MTQFGKKAREPVWQSRSRISIRHIPAPLRDWLFFSGSLTQRLIDACDGQFAVSVVAQGRVRPLPNERRVLGMREAQTAFVRQVHLLCNGQPWVYARTIIPAQTLRGRHRRLTRLGGRSLGQVLFSDPGMSRDEMEVTCLHPGQPLFELASRGLATPPRGIWGRRSVFRLSGKPLLVSEFFLPDLATPAAKGLHENESY